MKILLIHPHDIYYQLEPWTSRIVHIGRALVGAGHEVRLICFAHRERTQKTEHNVPFAVIELSRRRRHLVTAIRTCTAHARWADVVHVQKCFPHAVIPAVMACAITDTPLHYDWDDREEEIYYASITHVPQLRWYGRVIGFFERRMLRWATTVSVASRALHALALSSGVPPQRVFDAPVGVDCAVFRPVAPDYALLPKPDADVCTVMYVGQLHAAQYVEMLIDAVARIDAGRRIRLVIVGDGHKHGDLVRAAHERGLAQWCVFVRDVRHEDVPRYLAHADIAVASFKDTPVAQCKSPLKVVEYMACGKAIVASRVGDVPAMLGDAGMLVEPGSAQSMADALVTLMQDEAARVRFGKLARERAVHRYPWEKTVAELLKAYTV